MINKSGSESSEWGEVSNEDMFYELNNDIKFIQTFTVRFLPKNMWKGVFDSFLKYDKVRVAICTKILPNFSKQLPDRIVTLPVKMMKLLAKTKKNLS